MKDYLDRLRPVEGLALGLENGQDTSLFLVTNAGHLVEFRTKYHKSFNSIFGLPSWTHHGKPFNSKTPFSSPLVGMVAGSALRIFVSSQDGRLYEWRMAEHDLKRREHGLEEVFKKHWVNHGIPGSLAVSNLSAMAVTLFGVFAEREDGKLARLKITSQDLVHVKLPSPDGGSQIVGIPKREEWQWVLHKIPEEFGGKSEEFGGKSSPKSNSISVEYDACSSLDNENSNTNDQNTLRNTNAVAGEICRLHSHSDVGSAGTSWGLSISPSV
eukprot:CAMPEP_0197543180 /NCGR_PEP_ID=MMETSP1318-20131121/68102_1 /TAXON_ID=552666 /ORGANISM="Partenskyella glossopodia, Strain RCC365" /LENGTH=269 /DNA_ID=CAMNT_0043102497 /DNA_START=634 /DNA_END=1443 /DNA_ORIENTATION=-